MTFDQVYERLSTYRTPQGEKLLFLLSADTMRSLYDCVLHTGATDCLELGTGYGATTCVIAAALDERGGGRVTTIDIMEREPIGITELAAHTGLGRYIAAVNDPAGYNWYLGDLIAEQTQGGVCAPCLDFCFLDGAHEWQPDALAVFLLAKLLRPGAWLAMDDLDFRLRGCEPNWQTVFASRSQKELDTFQLDRVFNLIVRQHPDYTECALAGAGRTGWARKKADAKAAWAPVSHVLDGVALDWQQTFAAADLVADARPSDGIATQNKAGALQVQASLTDPNFILSDLVAGGRAVDALIVRLRLVKPATETLQIFWITGEGGNFDESRSMRVAMAAADGWRDITIRINGAAAKQPLRTIRVDLSHGPSTVLWESLTLGGWHSSA